LRKRQWTIAFQTGIVEKNRKEAFIMKNEFLLYVFYTMKPGCRRAFLDWVRTEGILDAIRGENGCLRYEYFCAEEDENCLLLVEKWSSAEAQKLHMTQPHMLRLLAAKDTYIAETRLGRLHEEG